MDESNGNINNESVSKEQHEANTAIEAEVSGAKEAATQPENQKKNSQENNIPLVLVCKRPGEPNPTEIEPPQKKPKLEETQTQDVANAAPPQAEGNASKEQEQKQDIFKAPKTPPGTSKASTALGTPPRSQLKNTQNPIYTPGRPIGVSRLIKDDEILSDGSYTKGDDIGISGSESEPDSDWDIEEEEMEEEESEEEEFEEDFNEDFEEESEENVEKEEEKEETEEKEEEKKGENAGEKEEKEKEKKGVNAEKEEKEKEMGESAEKKELKMEEKEQEKKEKNAEKEETNKEEKEIEKEGEIGQTPEETAEENPKQSEEVAQDPRDDGIISEPFEG